MITVSVGGIGLYVVAIVCAILSVTRALQGERQKADSFIRAAMAALVFDGILRGLHSLGYW